LEECRRLVHLRIAMPLAVMAFTAPRLGPCRSFTALADPPNCTRIRRVHDKEELLWFS